MTEFKPRFRILWREWFQPILIIVLIATTFRSAIADWNDVPTGSMKPTILEGDRIFVNKLAYDLRVPFTTKHLLSWADPDRGDIVVLNSPGDKTRLVKRVVGLPGDTVAMVANHLVVNRQPIEYELMSASAEYPSPSSEPRILVLEDLGSLTHTVMLTPGLPSAHSFGPILIPKDHYFVMGDNRDRSHDSRHFGFVERSAILGRATAVAASVNPERHYRPRWERFFTALR
ncbi:MAG: signal peptidase I [Thermoanaerobaculales bacterium]|nr:signal peptidase I [Thermoanaerobaculales bacterium]